MTREQEHIQQVVESLNEGVVVLDADGMITTVNRSARRLLGTERGHHIEVRGAASPDRRLSYVDGTPIDPAESPSAKCSARSSPSSACPARLIIVTRSSPSMRR